jgi:large subunit ribosomal protein L28
VGRSLLAPRSFNEEVSEEAKNIAFIGFNANIPLPTSPSHPNGGSQKQALNKITATRMSKVCQLSGKKKSTGFNVSHSNRHTKRTFNPNVTKRLVVDPVTGAKLRIKVSTRALRTMVKNPGKFRVVIASLVKKQVKKAAKRVAKK